MNGTKLSLLLLLSVAGCAHAEVSKKDATQQAPKKDYFAGGKECAQLLIDAISKSDQASQTKFGQKSQELLKPIIAVFRKGETDTPEATANWKSFQEFNRGFKAVFDKNTPSAPANFSALEKKGVALNIEAQKMSYDVALTSADFAAYNKTMQEKSQALTAKQMELQKEYQAQMATQAKPAETK